jgi:long-chain fatty acid transport protein
MSSRMCALLAVVTALLPASASAAGFSVHEQGGRGMGLSGAYTASGDDPSAIFHNPAGIGFLRGRQLYVGGTLLAPRSRFTGSEDPFPGVGREERQDVGIIALPAVYYTHALSRRLVAGIGLHSPFGFKTRWAAPDTFTGRFLSLEASLWSVSLNPTVAYKLADRLTLGAGLDLRLSKLQLRRRVPAIDPFTQEVVDVAEATLESDVGRGLGWNVGVVAKPNEDLALGFSYRHKVTVDYTGSAAFARLPTGSLELDELVDLPRGRIGLSTAVTFPAIASAGVSRALGDWTLAADLVFFQWSSFDRLQIVFDPASQRGVETLVEEYTSTWQVRAGVERRLGDVWAVRGGYHFDRTPVPAESLSPRLPDADRHGLAAGASWTQGRTFIDAGVSYVFMRERSTGGLSRERFDGAYKNSAISFGASLGYKF